MRYLLILLAALSLDLPTLAQEAPEEKLISASKGLFPAGWIVSSLDEQGWNARQIDEAVHTHIAFTIIPQHLTVIRASYVQTHSISEIRHVLAHEAGHIRCNCRDEGTAEFWAHVHL